MENTSIVIREFLIWLDNQKEYLRYASPPRKMIDQHFSFNFPARTLVNYNRLEQSDFDNIENKFIEILEKY